ncbi:MAG: AraC family transcriptional regulator [Anaerolineae bacterium]|nr:AraC family transcriptional regulator [Anaerolineae bacterium]
MDPLRARTLDEFYETVANAANQDVISFLPPGINADVGHFNVFNISETLARVKQNRGMPYNRRAYYKINLSKGRNRTEYADKVIDIEKNALLFATPKVPYHWIPQDEDLSGRFCIFTDAFMVKTKSGVVLDELPIFRPGGYPVFEIDDAEAEEIGQIFDKMENEIVSDYEYKYDLLRNYVLELIHYGQKLQPATTLYSNQTGSARITSLFIELLERQFPIEATTQKLGLRSAHDYAERLSIHVNYLNKALKENTGQTTTELIGSRIALEAKLLLKQTDWSISEIAYTLGFEEVAHFSNFFKKQASISPQSFRS